MKRAFLVTGPESSGSCYMTRLLIEAGCSGVAGGHQPFDGPNYSVVFPEIQPPFVVIQRSLPHADTWPDLLGCVSDLWNYGYHVILLVMVRDQFCQETSQYLHKQARKDSDGIRGPYLDNLSEAFATIAECICRGVDGHLYIPYESLKRQQYRDWLVKTLELPGVFKEPFMDGDERYLCGNSWMEN